MTNMNRLTISLDQDMYDEIYRLRKEDDLLRCSFSEIVRIILRIGLETRKNTSLPAPTGTSDNA